MNSLTASGVSLEATSLLRLRHLALYRRVLSSRRVAALPGRTMSRRRGHGLEIDDIRVWSPGDDVRHIDRNVTARTGIPYVRTFRAERDQTTLLFADFRPSMLFGTKRAFRSIAAAEALALVGWRVIAQGGRVGLLTTGAAEPVFVSPSNGERAMTAVVGAMVQAHARAVESKAVEDPPLDVALEMAARCLPRGGTLVMATALDETGDAFLSIAHSLMRSASLRVILIRDAFECRPPAGLYPFVTGRGRRGWGKIAGSGAPRDDARLAMLADIGVRPVQLDAELEPEAFVAVLERLDAPSQ